VEIGYPLVRDVDLEAVGRHTFSPRRRSVQGRRPE
jgi:hypothetical protein